MLAVLADWRERLQDEVDAATTRLQIAPIAAVIVDGEVDAQALLDPRSISLGRDFVRRIGKVVGLVSVYREIGQIYVTDNQLVLSPCDREMARDRVAGWLCGMRDISIGADETFAPTYGATILQVANNAPYIFVSPSFSDWIQARALALRLEAARQATSSRGGAQRGVVSHAPVMAVLKQRT